MQKISICCNLHNRLHKCNFNKINGIRYIENMISTRIEFKILVSESCDILLRRVTRSSESHQLIYGGRQLDAVTSTWRDGPDCDDDVDDSQFLSPGASVRTQRDHRQCFKSNELTVRSLFRPCTSTYVKRHCPPSPPQHPGSPKLVLPSRSPSPSSQKHQPVE